MNDQLIEMVTPYLTSIFGAYASVIFAIVAFCYLGMKVIRDVREASGSLRNAVDMSDTNTAIKSLIEENRRLLEEIKKFDKQYNYIRFRVDEINKKVSENEKK